MPKSMRSSFALLWSLLFGIVISLTGSDLTATFSIRLFFFLYLFIIVPLFTQAFLAIPLISLFFLFCFHVWYKTQCSILIYRFVDRY
jgi:glucan phosphoethanolaminetransferase (alkaline phosphatase superfamily)